MQGVFGAELDLGVGFSDRRCQLFGRLGIGKPVALHFCVKQLSIDVQVARGLGAVPTTRLKGLANHRSFKFGDGGGQVAFQKLVAGGDLPTRLCDVEICRVDRVASYQHAGARNHVAQLAHIAGPGMLQKQSRG